MQDSDCKESKHTHIKKIRNMKCNFAAECWFNAVCSLHLEIQISFTLCVFSARQIGFEEEDQVPALCIVAQDYLRKSKGCDQSIYEYLANENDAGSLYVKLVDEFERCILSYFAFHWTQAPSMISQVFLFIIHLSFHLYFPLFSS